MIENIESLDKQEEQLTGVTKMAHETADTTHTIMKNMRNQRDKITTATADVREANNNVNVGKKIINTMTRQECCYKALLYMVIIVLFAAILALGIVLIHKKTK